MILRRASTMALLFTLAACGKESDENQPEPILNSPPEATVPLGLKSSTDDLDVLGVWKAACRPCGNNYCLQTVDFSETTLVWSLGQYADKQCRTSQMHVRHIGSFNAEKGFIKSQLAQVHMKLDFGSFKAAAEKSQSCGFNSWPLDTWLDITGHECPATPEKGGVWTDWTQPGESYLRASYIKGDKAITFKFSDGNVTYLKQ